MKSCNFRLKLIAKLHINSFPPSCQDIHTNPMWNALTLPRAALRCANCEPIECPFRGCWLDGRPILPLRIRWAANYINCDNFPSEIPKISRINCKFRPLPLSKASMFVASNRRQRCIASPSPYSIKTATAVHFEVFKNSVVSFLTYIFC
jgi:hypothetical protein